MIPQLLKNHKLKFSKIKVSSLHSEIEVSNFFKDLKKITNYFKYSSSPLLKFIDFE